ncbi:GNAT family N-acetyltransferase [Brunnivagina elsteri]|uniref:GNAT family N-acetyltransferase n=1 Tax=Brunnivagina elsteri CCALA 953 TaxID=987040 RepID=A0A2A2TPE1_9CYAN|nr:GNAT family N-acetyltransferase [Calothrix elsteri]PAX60381.1 GNAT family N-acetyltransferase [Calothrix elsteri CCALA 953]
MNLLQIEIITNRLVLKAIEMQYKTEIFREFTAEITTYMYPRAANDISETESFIQESLAGLREGYNLQLVILKKDTKEFLGCTGIHRINTKMPEFGIWLKKSAQGNYYGFETIAALKQWGEENLDCEGFIYPVDRDNYPSRKIPERLGGKIVKEYDKLNLSENILYLVEYWIPKQKTE